MTAHSLTLAEVTATPLSEGDTALIIKKDGSFQVANCHADFDPAAMTPMQFFQGRLVLAMTALLRRPALLDAVLRMKDALPEGVQRNTAH